MSLVNQGAFTHRPAPPQPAYAESPRETIERLAAELRKRTREIEILTEENQKLHHNLACLKETDARLGEEIRRLRIEKNQAVSEIARNHMAMTQADQALSDAHSQLADLHSNNEKLQARVDKLTTDVEETIKRHRIYDDKMHSDNHALAKELEAAKAKIEELRNMIRSSIENPTIMTTPWGNKPITAEGMRFVLDKAISYYKKYMMMGQAQSRCVKRVEGAIKALTDPSWPDEH